EHRQQLERRVGHAPAAADRAQLVVAVDEERDEAGPEDVGDDDGEARRRDEHDRDERTGRDPGDDDRGGGRGSAAPGHDRPTVTPSCVASEVASHSVRWEAMAPRSKSTTTMAATDTSRPVGSIPGITQATSQS